jgi:hypothetical protein
VEKKFSDLIQSTFKCVFPVNMLHVVPDTTKFLFFFIMCVIIRLLDFHVKYRTMLKFGKLMKNIIG